MNPTYYIKPEKLAGLYMTNRKRTRVTYDELLAYSCYIAQRYNDEHKNSKIVPFLSENYLKEAEHEYGHLLEFKKNYIKTKQHIDLKLIAKEIVAWISWCVTEPCTNYSKDFFEKQKIASNKEKESANGKKF